ncbi:MAG: Crp/Fnr family transcriptional regulator [Desulfurobacteriaceae bacterium]
MEDLRKIPLLSELSEEQLKKILSIATLKKYPKGKVIFTPSQKGEFFYILKKGKVKVFKTAKGKEQILKVFSKPAIFGEAASFTGSYFPAWAESLEESEVLVIPRKEFLNLLREDPEIGMKLLSVMAQRLMHLTGVIENLSLKDALSKVSSYILTLYGETGEEITFRTNIAAMELGLTKETVSRMLSKLKEMGIIEKKRNSIKVKDPEALKELSI